MVKRSLSASQQGITKAKRAFERKGWTQSFLATEVGLSTRQSVWKFFAGKPIDRHIFQEICFTLDLDWQTIADLADSLTDSTVENSESAEFNPLPKAEDFASFKQQYSDWIKRQCTFLQSSLEITNPQSLSQIYTTTYLLPELTAQKWLEISELENSHLPTKKQVHLERNSVISALEVIQNYPKLFILGKPGAGKTTFLQYIALQCQQNRLFSEFIPLFLRLHLIQLQTLDFARLDLLFLFTQALNCPREKLTHLLEQGQILLLLDGLDETSEEFQTIFLQKIQIFSDLYHKNRIIITSRLAEQNYHLRGFYYGEISDFNIFQVEEFVKKWFLAKNHEIEEKGQRQAEQFLKALDLPENQGLFELTRTPILLNFLCTLYYHRESFPSNRYKLYQTGLEILLVNWDQAKGINRDKTYQNLSLSHRIKLLSYIAEQNFQQGKYFFEKMDLLRQISDYLLTVSDSSKDAEDLKLISEEILTDIELQNGLLVERAKDIYSFSHLTFQEYLTARRLVNMSIGENKENQLKKLANHITDNAWHEVILMTSNLLTDPQMLLGYLKNQVDQLIVDHAKIQSFLIFIDKKTNFLNSKDYKPSAIRAFYLGLILHLKLSLSLQIDVNLSGDLSPELSLDLALSKIVLMSQDITENFTIHKMLDLTLLLDIERKYDLGQDFMDNMRQLKQQIPDSSIGKKALQQWWSQEGPCWVENLKSIINQYRYFNQDWQLSEIEQEILRKYYQATEFLLKCLYSNSQIDLTFQNQLENKLLIPSLGDN